MKPNFFTVLMVGLVCLTLYLCVKECCKAYAAVEMVKFGVLKPKVK